LKLNDKIIIPDGPPMKKNDKTRSHQGRDMTTKARLYEAAEAPMSVVQLLLDVTIHLRMGKTI